MPDPTILTMRFLTWQQNEVDREFDAGAKMFMGFPESWFDDPYWFCENGHVSGNYLKSEEDGNVCLACGERVILGPKIGETVFALILAKMKEGIYDG